MRTSLGFTAGSLPPVRNDVTIYSVTYKTRDLRGMTVNASGAVIVPDGVSGPVPLVACQHGTSTGYWQTPSMDTTNPDLVLGALCFAASGQVVSMADYLGFGVAAEPDRKRFQDVANVHKDGVNQQHIFHPYLDAKTEASTGLDMLRATRQVSDKLGVKLSPQLFITGYSQGGQAAMALHRLIESSPLSSKEFPVTASAPMAGPHNMPGSVAAIFEKPVPRSAAEVAYATIAYDNQKALAPARSTRCLPQRSPRSLGASFAENSTIRLRPISPRLTQRRCFAPSISRPSTKTDS